jgi:hypothetical protein
LLTSGGYIRDTRGMSENIELNLEQIGRQVAEDVAGVGNVVQVEAEEGEDWTHKPAHFFVFLINETQEDPPGMSLSSRISLRLRDELVARGDYRMPFVRILNRRDWDKRGRVWSH